MNTKRFASEYVPSAEQERTEWTGTPRPFNARTVAFAGQSNMSGARGFSLVRFALVAISLAVIIGAVAGIAF